MREGLARHHRVTLARVVEEDRFENGALLEIERMQTIEGIHVGVVGPRLIVHWILDVLEARQTNRIEGQVIGSTRVSVGDRGHAKIGQRCDPLLEDWADGEVLLCVDSAYLSGAVV